MAADLIVYGLVAAGLVFWLRNILGTRHGEERERPNPFMPVQDEGEDMSADKASPVSAEDTIRELVEDKNSIGAIDNKTAENGLLEISRSDKSFEVKTFIQAAQDAFVYIVEAFAAGDRETLKGLLAPNVYAAFDKALVEREEKGETQSTEIHSIRRAEIIEASLNGRIAFITLRFIADETSVTRDKEDEIISGHPDRVTEMRDIWTFSRDLKSRDPRWLVSETRGDFEGDNELIPDTD